MAVDAWNSNAGKANTGAFLDGLSGYPQASERPYLKSKGNEKRYSGCPLHSACMCPLILIDFPHVHTCISTHVNTHRLKIVIAFC